MKEPFLYASRDPNEVVKEASVGLAYKLVFVYKYPILNVLLIQNSS